MLCAGVEMKKMRTMFKAVAGFMPCQGIRLGKMAFLSRGCVYGLGKADAEDDVQGHGRI